MNKQFLPIYILTILVLSLSFVSAEFVYSNGSTFTDTYLENSLISAYNFNDSSIGYDLKSGIDFTDIENPSDCNFSAVGKLNGAWNFYASDSNNGCIARANYTNYHKLFNKKGSTFAMWFKANPTDVQQMGIFGVQDYTYVRDIFGVYVIGQPSNIRLYSSLEEQYDYSLYRQIGFRNTTDPIENPNNTWHFLTFTVNTTIDEYKYYIDGDLMSINTYNYTDNTYSAVWIHNLSYSGKVVLGVLPLDDGNNGYKLNGTLDELMVFNDTLDSIQIQKLYAESNGITWQPTPPTESNLTVTSNKPLNNNYTTNKAVTFNCSAVSTYIVDNMTLYLDSIENYTVSNSNLQTTLNLADGNHSWYCSATDPFNTNTSASRNLTVETYSDLIVTSNKPLNNNYTTNKAVTFNCSASSTAINGVTNMTLILDSIENYTTSNNELQTTLNLADGNHSWYCSATDPFNTNTSATRNVQVETTSDLIVTLNKPLNSNFTTTKTVIFNCSATSTSTISNVTLYIDDIENETVSSDSLQSVKTLSKGLHNWSCVSTDLFNTNSSTTWNLEVGSNLIVNLNTPLNNNYTNIPTVTFNCSAVSDSATIYNITLIIDDVENETVSSYNLQSVKTLSEGNHNWSCVSTDLFNTVSSTTNNLIIDAVAPFIDFNLPPNATNTINPTYDLNISVYDVNLYSVNLSVVNSSSDNTYFEETFDVNSTTFDYLNTISLDKGINTVTVCANDIFETQCEYQTITYLEPIYMTISYPTNTTYTTSISDLRYTTNFSDCDSAWYSLDNGVTNSSIVSCGINFTSLVSSTGSNTWTVYVNDSINQKAWSRVTFTYTPTITPIPPSQTSALYYLMASSGAGLGSFIERISLPLAIFLLLIAFIGIIILIAVELKGVLIKGGSP